MIVVGLGNPLRSDDNIGNYLAEKFGGWVAETTPENIMGKLVKEKPDKVVFIDAVEFHGKIGEVRLFQLEDIADQLISTHSFPLTMFLKFLPDTEIKVIGIKIKNHNVGREFSEEIQKLLPTIEQEVEALIKISRS